MNIRIEPDDLKGINTVNKDWTVAFFDIPAAVKSLRALADRLEAVDAWARDTDDRKQL